MTVPEATPERIERARLLVQESPAVLAPQRRETCDKALTDRDLVRLAEQELHVPLHQQDFNEFPAASLWARFLAHIVDSFLLGVTVILGFALMLFLFGKDIDKSHPTSLKNIVPLIAFASLPTILCIVQWVMIAKEGQSIGKKLLMVRIVTVQGRLPGFIQGVALRIWLRSVLNACIPFFGLLDPLVALNESKRSLHDLISGTRVVQLN